jgi:hypothetical protein
LSLTRRCSAGPFHTPSSPLLRKASSR